MIDFKFTKTLKPGDTVAVIMYGGILRPGIFHGISKLGTFQFYPIRDKGNMNVYLDRIQGNNINVRIAKINPEELAPEFAAHREKILKEIKL